MRLVLFSILLSGPAAASTCGGASGFDPQSQSLSFGAGALMCGLVFNQGAFRASDMKTNRMADFTVGPGPQGSLDATLASTGLPQFAIDLRTAPAGSVAEWLQAEHRSRQIGLSYSESNAGAYLQRMKAAKAYDLLIFVEKTSASRPL